MSQITEHQKELERRRSLPLAERAELNKQDSELKHKAQMARAAKVEAKVKERDKICLAIQNEVTSISMKFNKLKEMNLDIYESLIGPDCLFNDSPISDYFTIHWLKEFMIKKGFDFIGYVPDGVISVRDFTEKMAEAGKWAIKFTKDAGIEKTGIEAIL